MEEHLQNAGHSVMIADASDEPPTPEGFDGVILGGSLHMMKHQSALEHYASKHAAALNNVATAFFSVSLGIATGDEASLKEARRIANEFVHNSGWHPEQVELIAGALKYTQYDFFKRYMLKMISKKAGGDTDTSRDHEYTDWKQVAAFCEEFVKLVKRGIMVK